MAYKISRREGVLLGLLAVAGIAALIFGRGGTIFDRPQEQQELALLGDPPVVRLDRLDGAHETYDPQGRNLFEYSAPPRKAAPPPPPPPPPKRTTPQVRKSPPPRAAPPANNPGPQPPKIQFEYLGYLGPKENKIAVFENRKKEEIMLARAGEVVEGQFRLLEFKYESVVFGYTDERFVDKTTELGQKR